jgi:cell division protein FtsZ
LSIGEFQEVGNVIKQFASDDATVVVGPVIDPDMANQIRVTVVATGLGKPVAVARPAAQTAHAAQAAAAAIAPPLTMRMVRPRSPMAPTDYAMLDKPTVQRQRAVGDGLQREVESEDLLDIPAFLRRQAD